MSFQSCQGRRQESITDLIQVCLHVGLKNSRWGVDCSAALGTFRCLNNNIISARKQGHQSLDTEHYRGAREGCPEIGKTSRKNSPLPSLTTVAVSPAALDPLPEVYTAIGACASKNLGLDTDMGYVPYMLQSSLIWLVGLMSLNYPSSEHSKIECGFGSASVNEPVQGLLIQSSWCQYRPVPPVTMASLYDIKRGRCESCKQQVWQN